MMNNIYTEAFSEAFSEAFAESNPYEYKQKYTSKKGKQRDGNETSLTKKAKSYKQARDAKRMDWEMN